MIVTFDFGQTLAELDHEFLGARLLERGQRIDSERSLGAMPAAMEVYGALKQKGHAEAWLALMQVLLEHGGAHSARELSEWLWQEQPTKNLWRKPIAGMFELVSELAAERVPVGILSNSEGHLAELVSELGRAQLFSVIIDSGRVGLDKPDPRIFELAADRLGGKTSELVHIGDSWEADVEGALGAGARAIWFSNGQKKALPEGVAACRDAAEVRARLAELGLV